MKLAIKSMCALAGVLLILYAGLRVHYKVTYSRALRDFCAIAAGMDRRAVLERLEGYDLHPSSDSEKQRITVHASGNILFRRQRILSVVLREDKVVSVTQCDTPEYVLQLYGGRL